MVDWFTNLAAGPSLAACAASELQDRGFVIMPGPEPPEQLEQLVKAYDAAVDSAVGGDIRIGSTSTRVNDFVNRGAEFDRLYVFPPLLEACWRVIGRPFKLSSLHARTVRAHTPAQELHVDVDRGSADWPLVGFIFMIDGFRPDNGATRFVPGSHRWATTPEARGIDPRVHHADELLACGEAGSMLIFNGSAWHGHTANPSNGPRRSLQGAFIPQEGSAATGFGARMSHETRSRLNDVALRLTSSRMALSTVGRSRASTPW